MLEILIFLIIFALALLFFVSAFVRLLILAFHYIFKFPRKLAVISIFLVVLCFISYKYLEREHQLSFVPSQLQVRKIIYAKEKLYGLGRGGNETGIIIYKLPNHVAKEIEKQGRLLTLSKKKTIFVSIVIGKTLFLYGLWTSITNQIKND